MSEHGGDSGRPWDSRVLASRYRLVEFIARGGMAEVWEGHDLLLARSVAVKLPHPHLGHQEAFRKRFRREAVAAARLSHPNIVAIYDTGTDAEDNFIVMERVNGPSLRQVLVPEHPVSVDRAVGVAAQVARALAYAHRQGVIHRDIKPANILISQDDMVKVADFGIAKAALGDDLTQTGTALGTARYLAPEQVEGGSPDRRSDVYSLGVVLYEMVCGRPPFKADNEMALAFQHLRVKPPPPMSVCSSVPTWLEGVVLKALAKSPDERFSSADELRDALSQGAAWTDRDGLAGAGAGAGAGTAVGSLAGNDWSRPAVHVGAEPRSFPGPTGQDEPRQWAPTGSLGTTPTDRAGIDVESSGASTSESRLEPPAWPDTSGDARASMAAGAFDARPPPPPGTLAPRARGRRSRRRLVPVLALALALAAVVVAAVLVSHLSSPSRGAPAGTQSSSSALRGNPVTIASATAFDPPPGDGVEDDSDLPHLYDGNPSTLWHTEFYSNRQFGSLKAGVGFVLNLDQSHRLQDLLLTSPTPDYGVSVYVANSAGSTLSDWGQPVSSISDAPARAVLPLRGRQGSHVLVWFTRLSPSNVVQLSGAQLTS